MSAPRLAIIGAGEAGSAAAQQAVQFGLDVHLFDRFEIADLGAGITVWPEHPVWGLFPGRQVAASRGERSLVVDVDAVLLANGSTDKSVPFAGNTLPGVMTASALDRLIRRWRLRPGKRFVVVGGGQEAQSVTTLIADAGGDIVLQVDSESCRSMVVSGDGGVEQVTLDGEHTDADIVVMAAGTQPDLTLAAMAECELLFDDSAGLWRLWRDDQLRTSVEGIWAAGSVAGTSGDDLAKAEGILASASIALALGSISSTEFAAFQARSDLELDAMRNDGPRTRQPWRVDERIHAGRNDHA